MITALPQFLLGAMAAGVCQAGAVWEPHELFHTSASPTVSCTWQSLPCAKLPTLQPLPLDSLSTHTLTSQLPRAGCPGPYLPVN